jgi:signal transduction histidine kinase
MTLKLARRAFREGRGDPEALVDESLRSSERAIEELRELSHGILPAALHNGLRTGIDAFVSRLELPVKADVLAQRLPADVEASAYFIVAEGLTNVVKHARASRATVRASVDAEVLTVEVRDDGVGGADPSGHGLMGIADRVAALGGDLRVDSPTDAGTALVAMMPVEAQAMSSTTLP